ncbi:unnamed protein product [Bursaphelenchus okinawaensis]|uniref:7TM_GPCR_Srx domain-containing protein n=1 Tax=Bursaphelenchus okinawaensis TaxID=465554 RepID=A0A811JVR7_9BILA|nr:unnamed protein product [Bursaphelenchus okinawaensis]CAG9086040.1 unnamed protein product [Bursaphelenchus okinawaensis]
MMITTPVLISLPNQISEKQYLANVDPVIAYLFENNANAFCFGTGSDVKDKLVIGIGFLYVTPFLIVGSTLLIFIYIQLGKSVASASTYKLQMMLFKALLAQTIGTGVFLIIPGILYFSPSVFGIRNVPKIQVVAFIVYMLHSPFDCCMIIIFIKPYRRYFMNNFRRALNKVSSEPRLSLKFSTVFVEESM